MTPRRPTGRLPLLRVLLGAFAFAPALAAQFADASGLAEADAVPGAAQYDSLPAPLPASADSIGFAATGTSAFGDLIRLHGASHFVGRVAILLSSGANHADYPGASPHGFMHPVTLALHAVDRSSGAPRPDRLLARVTESFLIPWRNEIASAGFPDRLFVLTFDLAPLGLALPDEVILSVAFNTAFHGRFPTGRAGPHDRLGVALTNREPAIGEDVDADAVFWHSSQTGTRQLVLQPGWTLRPAIRMHGSVYGELFELVGQLETLRGPDPRAEAGLRLAASLVALALDRELWDGNAQLSPALGGDAFDLLAEAAGELALVGATPGVVGAKARAALDTLTRATAFIAETTLADALIFGGDPDALLRAQSALDLAAELKTSANPGAAVDAFSEAWTDAQAGLR